MKAIILAAGLGKRLESSTAGVPKCLLEFGGKTLLQRHLEILGSFCVGEVIIGVGYQAKRIEAALAGYPSGRKVKTVYNSHYEQGSIVTLWALRGHLAGGGDILLMDADVLYDRRMLEGLLASAHRNCFLLDRNLEPGAEPVKLCIRDGGLVEFRKQVEVSYDYCGESVGFFRFSEEMARRLVDAAARYIDVGHVEEPYEEAIREILLAQPARFGVEDITGLPWIEIDFPEDVAHARDEILPRLQEPSD